MSEDLQSRVLKEYFPSGYTYHVEKMEIDEEDYRNFECTIRIKALLGAVEQCTRWLSDFSELTKTSWRDVKENSNNPTGRHQFTSDMICNYGGCKIMEVGYGDRCAAYLKIRVKKYTYAVLIKDALAARGFLTIIDLSFYHNHLLLATRSTFTHSYRPKDEITLMLLNYCSKGFRPKEAKTRHEKYLKEHKKQEDHSSFKDKVLNPPLSSISIWFKSWVAAEKAGFKLNLQFCREVRKKTKELEKQGYIIQDYQKSPTFTVVCTPIMQNCLRILAKSVKSTNHLELTTQFHGTPTNKCILLVNALSGIGPVPVCAAFYVREMGPDTTSKLHLSVRKVLNQYNLTCEIDRAHDQFVLPDGEPTPLTDLCQPTSSAKECVFPEAELSKNSENPVVRESTSSQKLQSVSSNQEVQFIHKDQQDEMDVDISQESEGIEMNSQQVEVFNNQVVDAIDSQFVEKEEPQVAQVDINKTRINLNFIADLVTVFQNDPLVISAVKVFNENVDCIETPKQLAAFLNNFVPHP